MAELTVEAKQAVQRYMVRLVAIPSVVFGVLAFLGGFFVDKVATQEAYQRAHGAAFQSALSSVSSLAADASAAATKANEALRDAQTVVTEAGQLRDELRTHKQFQQTADVVQKVADSLADREDFWETVGDRAMTEVNQQLRDARSSLRTLSLSVNALSNRTQNLSSDGCATAVSLGEGKEFRFRCDGNVAIRDVDSKKARSPNDKMSRLLEYKQKLRSP